MTGSWRWFAGLAAFGLMAAACGGDDDDETTAAESAPTTAADMATTAADTATTAIDTATTAADTATTAADTATTAGSSDTTSGNTGATSGASIDPASIKTDIGVDDTTIKVGMIADLSGAFAPLVREIADAQTIYWDHVNAQGGIAGRQIEVLIEDNGYDVATHVEKYEKLRNEVAILSQSTGSPHTAATADMLIEDDLIAIPLSFYSGWADPEIGKNVFESYTTYCLESMNGIEWLAENRDVQTVALISFPGEYGGDGAAGARIAIEELGLEIVYDGVEQVTPPSADNPTPDQSAVISQIVQSDADLVWSTINPTTLAAIMGAVVGQGFDGLWSGNWPSFDFKLLGTELAPALDQYYITPAYVVTWGTDVPGMAEMVETMTAARPDLPVSNGYVFGWTGGQITRAILEQAAANGDMTRAGIVAAANEVSVSFDGLAPDQTWAGDPNDYIVRDLYMYDVVLDNYNPTTLREGTGEIGSELLDGPFVGDVAANFTFEGPCYTG